MKISKVIMYCLLWYMFFHFVSYGDGTLQAAKVEDKRWSFDFKNCTVSDALRQMSQVTGIGIFMMNQKGDKQLLSKSYKDQTIDRILRDILRQENYAMLWNYDVDDLDAIDIWIFKDSSSRANFTMQQLSEQRLMQQRKDKMVHKSDFKPGVESSQSDNKVVVKYVSSQSKKGDPTKKEPNISFVYRYSKPSGSENMLPNPELSVPNAGIAPEDAEEKLGGANEVNLPPSLTIPEVPDPESNGTAEGIAEEENQAAETVPPPVPKKWHGLEPPPMPPGF